MAPKVPEGVAAQPDVQSMNANIKSFLAASSIVPVTVCPVNCFNMGSFYGEQGATSTSSCTRCSNAQPSGWQCKRSRTLLQSRQLKAAAALG